MGDRGRDERTPLVVLNQLPLQISIRLRKSRATDFGGFHREPVWPALGEQII